MRGIQVLLIVFALVCVAHVATADVLILNLNGVEFSANETVTVYGHTLNDDLSEKNNTLVHIYLDGVNQTSTRSDSSGYYEHSIANIARGDHTIIANTSTVSQTLTLTALAAKPTYQVIATTLAVPLTNPVLNFTVRKYLSGVLQSDVYNYTVSYENGTRINTSTGVSGSPELVTLPAEVGLYTVVVDKKKPFTASVSQFDLVFKITDKSGNPKDVFKPNGIAYFEVQGYASGQRVANATVKAIVTDASGTKNTVTFTEQSGVYSGNTNVTQTGTPITLRSGTYDVEFRMKDSSNNQQKVKGFFHVKGLNIDVELQDKVPYETGDTAYFEVVVKNLENGNLIGHNSTTYRYELERDGVFYDVSGVQASASSEATATSTLAIPIQDSLDDGRYALHVSASASGKTGNSKGFFEVMNDQVYVDLTDNYDDYRDTFKPGELAKVQIDSNSAVDAATVKVKDKKGVVQSTDNNTINALTGSISFNVPTTQDDFVAVVEVNLTSGTSLTKQRWFHVQNYMSFLDVKSLSNEFDFIHAPGDEFLGEINVIDVTSGTDVDTSGLTIKFNKIVNEDTQTEYTNIQSTKNTTYSDDTSGRATYNIVPPTLPNGFYRIEYTLVNSQGESFKGKGWFGISDLDLSITTYNAAGEERKQFASGETVNITVQLSTSDSGTATLYRDMFEPVTFTITDGIGSTTLTAAQNELPTESGFFDFGVEMVTSSGTTGLGEDFFEVRNLNFRSITPQRSGKFGPDANIVADVVVEKSGDLIDDANVTLARLVRARDGYQITATATASPSLTNSVGRTTITIDPASSLQPGFYFAELKAKRNNSQTYGGFGFQIVENVVLVTINDADKIFSTTDSVEVNVKVTLQNDTPVSGASVNLTGLLSLSTWAPVTLTDTETTSSNGVVTLTVSAPDIGNYNLAGRYVPIISVENMSSSVVGFGEGEFEIKQVDATMQFANGLETYGLSEDIGINVSVVGGATVTVTAAVEDENGIAQSVDSFYTDGVLTINNDLSAGEYFVDVTVTQSSSSITKRLWFEVIAPQMHTEPLSNPNVDPTTNVTFTYTAFTFGATGRTLTTAEVNITRIDNLWTGASTQVGELFNATSQSTYVFNLSDYTLERGDYELRFEIPTNPEYEHTLYFRAEKDVSVSAQVNVTENENSVTINVSTSGLTNPDTYLEGYHNHESGIYTSDGSRYIQDSTLADFTLTGLDNGFYQATLRVVDDAGETIYYDVFFEIRVRDVTISAPESASVNSLVTFNVTATSATNFYIIDPFTQSVALKQAIDDTTVNVTYTFTRAGNYLYSYGATKWDAFPVAQGINVNQVGFSVEWPYEGNRFVLSNLDENMSVNVTSGVASADLTFTFKNHFTGQTYTKTGYQTHASANTEQEFSFNISDVGLTNGPHDVEVTVEDGSNDPPSDYFFIDVFPDQYDIWFWKNQWEVDVGQNITLNIEVYDITGNFQRVAPAEVELEWLENPNGDAASATLYFTPGENIAKISTSANWITGNYRGEFNVTKGSTTRHFWIDFFVRGNDNYDVYWNQDKWEYAQSDNFTLVVSVRDKGEPVENVEASLQAFETRPDSWDEMPTSVAVGQNYSFTPENKTNSSGQVKFKLDILNAGLETGGYTGRLLIGGKTVWFDFEVQTYKVDAYPEEWEYGIADTIQINVRARDIETWNPIDDNGNVSIIRIMQHEMDSWQPTELNLSAFGLYTTLFDVSGGEAFIEMQLNQSEYNISQPYNFEVELEMNLSGNGVSRGFAWFKMSNIDKPSVTIVDKTGSAPSTYYGGETYTFQVTNVQSGTLKNVWGPCGRQYNVPLVNTGSALVANFTTPNCPGGYTIEAEVMRSAGYTDMVYTDFTIGSGTDMFFISESDNVVPGVNFTVQVMLYGESDIDPFCARDPNCEQNWPFFGPIANKSLVLKSMKKLDDFTTVDLTASGYNSTTNEWPEALFTGEGMMQMDESPGLASFNLNPTTLGMEEGKKYNLYFSYVDDDGTETLKEAYYEVEEYHVAISRKTSNIGAGSSNQVWVKTTDLYGRGISNCTITFNGIYSEKDDRKVKTLTISQRPDTTGELTFTYAAPTLPGDYLVQGYATCNISGVEKKQDIDYSITVGSKNLYVDMKTRFKDEENIKISITTKDRLGQPESQRLEVNMFHDRDDYAYPVYSLGGTDCTVLDANQDFEHGTMDSTNMVNNRLEVETDANGNYELELCPMPNGVYMVDIFPMFGFAESMEGPMEGPKDDDQFGFSSIFTVSSADVTAEAESLVYEVGDLVNVTITALDEFGNPITGNVVAADSFLEDYVLGKDIVVWNLTAGTTVALDSNGQATFNFTIPAQAAYELNESLNYPVTLGTLDFFAMIEDTTNDVHSFENVLGIVKQHSETAITATGTTKTNELINLSVRTVNTSRNKVQMGIYLLKENADKEKMWTISNGAFFEDVGGGISEANFSLLAPREPGDYYIGMMIFPLSSPGMSDSEMIDMILAPLEVTLDLVNVSGRITESDNVTAISGATVQIGKRETTTDVNGDYELFVPKGTYRFETVVKNGTYMKHIMRTSKTSFTADTIVNLSVYRVSVSGNLTQKVFNITSPSTDLSTMKVRLNVTVSNPGPESLLDYEIRAVSMSGEEQKTRNASNNTDTTVFFQNLYAGFETDYYTYTVKLKDGNWNSHPYVLINGVQTNATVEVQRKYTYQVETYAVAGDSQDNDKDCGLSFDPVPGCTRHEDYVVGTCIDEEWNNNKDDDCDGKIDEDLRAENYVEWCGNGFCSMEESSSGSCNEDCALGFCGDGICSDGEESWCSDDCTSVDTCSTPNECLTGPYFCNSWNITEYANWCESTCGADNCWACGTSGTSPNTECESVGCSLGTDGSNTWCYKQETCGDDACHACTTSEACGGTTSCEWEVDVYSPNGGYCNRIWDCSTECAACADVTACDSSTASWNGAGCEWETDSTGSGWCQWNATYGPVESGGEGIIKNVWFASDNQTDDWQSVIDYRNFSGNKGTQIQNGSYYILFDMGDTSITLKINGTEFVPGSIDNVGGYWGLRASDLPYSFGNGTYHIEVIDTIGPDYISWNVTFGYDASVSDFDSDGVVDASDNCIQTSNADQIDTDTDGYGDECDNGKELIMSDQNITNTPSTLSLNFSINDVTESPICGGTMNEPTEQWVVSIDSLPGVGCNLGSCWLNSDYMAIFEVNSTGTTNESLFKYWTGTAYDVNETVSVTTAVNCTTHQIVMTLPLVSINVTTNRSINVTFETKIRDTGGFLINIQNITHEYNVSNMEGA